MKSSMLVFAVPWLAMLQNAGAAQANDEKATRHGIRIHSKAEPEPAPAPASSNALVVHDPAFAAQQAQGMIGWGVNDMMEALSPAKEAGNSLMGGGEACPPDKCKGKELHDAVATLFKSWSQTNLPKEAVTWNAKSQEVWQDTDKLRVKALEMLQRLLKAHYYLSLQAQGFALEPKTEGSQGKYFEPLLNNESFYSNYYQSPIMRLKRMGEFYWERMEHQRAGNENSPNIGMSNVRDQLAVSAHDSSGGHQNRGRGSRGPNGVSDSNGAFTQAHHDNMWQSGRTSHG